MFIKKRNNAKGSSRTSIKKVLNITCIFFVLFILAGCSMLQKNSESSENKEIKKKPEQSIGTYKGNKSKAVSMVYTTKPVLSLTFNGMGDSDTMEQVLDLLDQSGLKATFFLPGMRVAEEPEIALEIKKRGHEIENNTLNGQDMSKYSYEDIYKEIHLANKVIEEKVGVKPKYVRTVEGDYNEKIQLATAHNGQKAVIGNSLFLHNWRDETVLEKQHFIRKYMNRGGIITLDTEENKDLLASLSLIIKAAKDVGYEFIPVDNLMAIGNERKPLQQIPGYDAAKVNLNYKNVQYTLNTHMNTSQKVVALSFDDWGTDYTITKILNILEKYNVKASFFLRADGVEKNPNLARAIYEGGHDVGNHTYSHPIFTKSTPLQIQEDIVKAHRVITEAIQAKPTMLLRPPTGAVTDKEAKIIAATGYTSISNYDVTPTDFDRKKSAVQIVNSIMEQTRNGSVILLHTLDDTNTIEALPMAIEQLRQNGYRFVKMTDVIKVP
ncbi:polysaccharide deacetylase family protein [Bacillus sp. 1P06AnD]|uniref:polysaccharide deacetylase family protein n=1 Tax=Bacillus sp. 1P06AnD TaxID=3132208 RepID=UPI0039A03650